MTPTRTLYPRNTLLRTAMLLALIAGATVLAACHDAVTEGMEETDLAAEAARIDSDSSLSADKSSNFQIALGGCGNGIQAAGELCFKKPVLVTSLNSELGGMAVGRINGGAQLDFVVGAVTLDKIRTKFGAGNGAFPGTHTWTMGDGPTDVALADFNGDNKVDIIATNVHTKRVRIRWGHTGWKNWSWWGTGGGPWRVTTGDLNKDGLDDFVTTNTYADNLTVRRRKASGGFTSQTYAAGDAAYDVELADCDNDGDLDLFYPSGLHHAAIQIRRNNGSGSFGAPATVDMNSGYNDNFHAIALADFNNDGHIDLVAARNSHALVRVLGNGNCTFQAPVVAPVSNNPYQIYTHDLDKDGNKDLVVAHLLAARVTAYLGKGNGDFAGPYTYDSSFGVNGHTSDVGVGDFNDDGSPDILFNGSDGVYIMNSNP